MNWKFLLVVLWAGCADPVSDACRLTADDLACPLCLDGPSSCELDGISTSTDGDCGACFSRVELMSRLCAEGSTVTEEEIYGEGVCEQ